VGSVEISGPSFDNLNFTFLYSSSFSPTFARDLDRTIALYQLTESYKTLKSTYFNNSNSAVANNSNSGNNFVRVWLPTVMFMGAIVLYFLWLLLYHLCVSRRRSRNHEVGMRKRNNIMRREKNSSGSDANDNDKQDVNNVNNGSSAIYNGDAAR